MSSTGPNDISHERTRPQGRRGSAAPAFKAPCEPSQKPAKNLKAPKAPSHKTGRLERRDPSRAHPRACFRHSDLVLEICFGFRASNFGFVWDLVLETRVAQLAQWPLQKKGHSIAAETGICESAKGPARRLIRRSRVRQPERSRCRRVARERGLSGPGDTPAGEQQRRSRPPRGPARRLPTREP